MWENPIYKLNQFLGVVGDEEKKKQRYYEIVIDVTSSAPSFNEPGEVLKKAFSDVFYKTKIDKTGQILDFGGGKLRNALYLLKQGYKVCVVEYKEQFIKSKQAKENLEEARSYKDRFSTLIYPHEFLKPSDKEFDLVLLINVINIMPIPAERLMVLQCCHKKLRPGGFLFSFTQHGDAAYRGRLVPQFRVGDGYYIGRNKRYKTFYREYTVAEIDDLASSAGFDLKCPIKAAWWNQARLYWRQHSAPLSGVLTTELIDKVRVVDDKIPNPKAVQPNVVTSRGKKSRGIPNPDKLKLEELLSKALSEKLYGDEHASVYEDQVKSMLELLFSGELRNLVFKSNSCPNPKYRYILADNKSQKGFFTILKSHYGIKSSKIVIECRNMRHSLENKAFDQLGRALGNGNGVGLFGMLAYRGGIRRTVIERCQRYFRSEGKVILPLDDNDFEHLLDLKKKFKSDDIESYLTRRLTEVIRPAKVFVSYSRKDKKYLEELQVHLAVLVQRGIVSLWDDTKLKPSQKWNEQISAAINSVDVAILLVSAHFLASEFIIKNELEPLLDAWKKGKVKLFPVLIRSVDLPPELSAMQFVNNIAKPLVKMRPGNRDDVWVPLVREIKAEIVKSKSISEAIENA